MTKQEFMFEYQKLSFELERAKDRAKRRETESTVVGELEHRIATLRSAYRRSKNAPR